MTLNKTLMTLVAGLLLSNFAGAEVLNGFETKALSDSLLAQNAGDFQGMMKLTDQALRSFSQRFASTDLARQILRGEVKKQPVVTHLELLRDFNDGSWFLSIRGELLRTKTKSQTGCEAGQVSAVHKAFEAEIDLKTEAIKRKSSQYSRKANCDGEG